MREDSLLTTMSSILLHILTANACKRKTAIDCGNCPEPCSPREKMPVVFLCCYSSAASLHFPPGYMHSMTHCLMVSLKQKNIDTVMIIFNHKLQSIQQSLNVLHPSKPLQGPPAPPHAVPWRNYFSFLKDNSCSKCSSRSSWVSQNEICRSEQEAVIVSLMYLHVSPSLDGKATSRYLLTAWRESHWRQQPPRFSRGHHVGSGTVFRPETLWPFIYGHQDINLKLLLEWRQLSQRNLCLCASHRQCRV